MQSNRNEEFFLKENELEPFTLVYDVLKNITYIIIGALAMVMLTYVVINIKYTPQYTSTATFIVGAKDSNNTYRNINSAYEMAQIFGKILQSNTLEELLCEQMEVKEIEAEIKAEVVENTNMLILSVTADDPKEAYDIINAVMSNYTQVPFYSISGATMNILIAPQVPFSPDNPLDVNGTVKKAFWITVIVLIFVFGVLSYLNGTIKEEREIENKLDAKSLGSICYEQKYKTLKEVIKHKKGAILVDSPIASFSFIENYRKLASKLEYKLAKCDGKVLVVTSTAENEGKSTVAANLAITFSEYGKKVLLIDGDIRRPSQFLILGMNIPGEKNELGEYLAGDQTISDILLKGDRKDLLFVGGKNCYSSSTERLQSDRLALLLKECREKADIIIIDTPPAGVLADAQILGQHADGILFVARQNFIVAEEINEILDDLRDSQIKILGVVLNGVQSFSNILGVNINSQYGKYEQYSNYGKYSRKRGK
ncbi:MAG: polysaccharide biosynthesis tyrosine autokinase [Schaedlerella sp.]|nr:polysaccharide biosynthesis tyrosine autokinase [Schaedlerella sp.]